MTGRFGGEAAHLDEPGRRAETKLLTRDEARLS